ncbi:MAG: hypothetical protein ACR2LC_10845 [Pyrinomonadaceae bacterium]
MMKKPSLSTSLFVFLLIAGITISARAQTSAATTEPDDENVERTHGSALIVVRRLINRDAVERQRAAEELARLADPEPRNLVEGYRLQEKNARVRLALDWALFRMGKTEALFGVVQSLDSSRTNQAEAYLAQLETPEPLYKFLDLVNAATKIKVLESFARNGDARTLEQIKSYKTAADPRLADAAQFATREIERRQSQPPVNKATRPRQTTNIVIPV